jgi:hypothetical protein
MIENQKNNQKKINWIIFGVQGSGWELGLALDSGSVLV